MIVSTITTPISIKNTELELDLAVMETAARIIVSVAIAAASKITRVLFQRVSFYDEI